MSQKINRAGVIPYYIDESGTIKMLFMKPTNAKFGGDCFQIAKGKQEDGEQPEDTAFREANEELGLFKPNCDNIHDMGNFLGRTNIFIAEVQDLNMFGDPDSETGSTKWLTVDEFLEEGRMLHAPVVKAVARRIEKQQAKADNG